MDITRRDFINGIALSVTAGGTLSPLELLASASPGVYPPELAGMRGNHLGSFEVAHALARDGRSWPHGYAYEYNELYDPPEWTREDGPHRIGARQVGRISIANSDAEAFAYVNGAIDAAYRAVNEQLGS